VSAAATVVGLSWHAVAMLLLATAMFGVLIWDRLPIATVCLAVLAVLPLAFALFPYATPLGETDPMRFFAGFGHPALVAICSLMILGHALVVTGALEPMARRLAAWVAAAPRLAPLGVMLGAALTSGLVNDTPVVVLLIPLVIAAAQRAKAAASSMLLPMNYAVLIGGMATTIGTSTNLIVVAIAAGLGVGPFSLFEFYPLVAMVAVPALLYLWLIAPRLLKHVQQPAEMLSAQVFEAELKVEADSWLDGRPLREAFKATGHRLQLVELRRGHRAITRLPSLRLRAGDRLLLQDTAANLKDVETSLRAKLHGMEVETPPPSQASESSDEPKAPVSAIVAQLIVTPESPLVGRSIRQERIAERYGVVVVGLRPRQGRQDWQREDPSTRSLAAGDILLMQGPEASMQQAQHDGVGLLLDAQFTLPRQHKAALALWTMAAVVLLAATKMLPISLAALGGVLVLLFARCLSWQEVAQSLSVKVVLLVAASLALGDALELTGAIAFMAQQLASVTAVLSPAWVLALLMALMGLLTNFVSNNAAAAIGTPLGIELARSLGVPPEPFVLAVLFGCNLCYMTPMGYQTNLLVMNAGGYKFGDFVRVGAPLFVIMWAGLAYALVQRYGL
jgi:di/tricarboxylate transporter